MPTRKSRTRFAPSPTGYLHLGHAYSALQAWDFAKEQGGELVLRIEDTDLSRARPEFEAAIFEDLKWLGLEWKEPVRKQSEHFDDYEKAVTELTNKGLTYPCFCTRKEIQKEVEASGRAPHGPDGPIYPGTCRDLSQDQRRERMESGATSSLRLDVARSVAALEQAGALPLHFATLENGKESSVEVDPFLFGDIVIARKGTPTSYHVSAVYDDALEGITHIIRGEDLLAATHVQRVLQALWGYAPPIYSHHPLVRDETGRRLAKRDKDLTLQEMRASGLTPDEVREKAEAGVEIPSSK